MDDQTKAVILGQVRNLLLMLGTLLAGHGIIGENNAITPDNWQFFVGVLIAVAPIAWGWWNKIREAKTIKEKEAIAVQAGINLVSEGASILIEDKHGNQVPKPVTEKTAQEIIKNFGPLPDDGTATDELNRRSLAVAKGLTP